MSLGLIARFTRVIVVPLGQRLRSPRDAIDERIIDERTAPIDHPQVTHFVVWIADARAQSRVSLARTMRGSSRGLRVAGDRAHEECGQQKLV